jgi:hypothetical protein
VTLKAILVAVAAVAIAIAVGLPILHSHAEPKSQIEQIELRRG